MLSIPKHETETELQIKIRDAPLFGLGGGGGKRGLGTFLGHEIFSHLKVVCVFLGGALLIIVFGRLTDCRSQVNRL